MYDDELFEPIEVGLWQPPQWLGAEIKPMSMCIITPVIALLSKNLAFLIVTLIISIGVAFALRKMYEVEPANFEILLRHRRIGNVLAFDRVPKLHARTVRPPNSKR